MCLTPGSAKDPRQREARLPSVRTGTGLTPLSPPGLGTSSIGTAEWLPDLAADADTAAVLTELAGRPAAVRVRTGYLLQNLRPDIAAHLIDDVAGKVRFGPRGPLRRHDARWQVADTILPFPPTSLTTPDGPP